MGLTETTYEKIIDLLFTTKIGPGTPLIERRLASVLGVSRTPVREALVRLELEGLVVKSGGQLTTVGVRSVREVMEIFHIRRLLETEAAGLAAVRTMPADKVFAIRSGLEAVRQSEQPSAALHWQADSALHSIIAESSGNEVLCDLILKARRRSQITHWMESGSEILEAVEDSLSLLDAIVSGDPVLARARMSEHIEQAARTVIQQLVPESSGSMTLYPAELH